MMYSKDLGNIIIQDQKESPDLLLREMMDSCVVPAQGLLFQVLLMNFFYNQEVPHTAFPENQD